MKNWKTSLIGVGLGAANMFANGTSWKQILFSVGFSALGIFAKDAGVSGTGL